MLRSAPRRTCHVLNLECESQVFHGPRDVWEQHHEEHSRSLYRRVLDGGEVSLLGQQII